MCRTVTPGTSSTTGGRSLLVALVKISDSMPRWASRLASSTMKTFMPPASPVPGWSRGEVWTLMRGHPAGQLVPDGTGGAHAGGTSSRG